MRDADVTMAARAVLVVERTPLALVVPKAVKAIGQKRECVSFHGKQNEGFNAIVKKKPRPRRGGAMTMTTYFTLNLFGVTIGRNRRG